MIQRIVTATNDNIFWLVNTTLYTWEYLHKSTGIGECFEYQVNLSDMNVEQVTEVIESRNKISGYNILFEIPDGEKNNKNLRKLSDDEIQNVYRKKYFDSLNKFTKSNLSLSLLYWQLSANEVSEDTITIRPFIQPDLSFISSFDKTKNVCNTGNYIA